MASLIYDSGSVAAGAIIETTVIESVAPFGAYKALQVIVGLYDNGTALVSAFACGVNDLVQGAAVFIA